MVKISDLVICVPRASGDKPDRVVPVGHVALCSPRQRG
ncbi:hypothetical protein STM474_3094 [Salmonella enterica subsp. enterica serovar Typhimurium str. ST4/74]|uniref:Uncharacterized protein n=1 Tax=Salmonella typhimurium (strain 4/74) TaxID=909946 RepID=E8X8N3_SALT4|nr:hypothetical protein STM474_3094 [Salmonella enterica subsp. enterica serovar Typhimurium str. ST4/74]AKD09599.1 hypothetical protein AX05_36710 [Salmonella enterica subsp. enterica serovar Typhimurium str. CDC 2011K-0870]